MFIFVSVFHRILDFKTGLDFYPGPFFIFKIIHDNLNTYPCMSVALLLSKFSVI